MIRRGQVYFVNLDPTRGREQRGRRPVVVVSSNAINSQRLVVTVVPGTDARKVPRDYPVNVRVAASESGLELDTVFLCFQVRPLDPARFVSPGSDVPRPAGEVPPGTMREIDEALRLALDL